MVDKIDFTIAAEDAAHTKAGDQPKDAGASDPNPSKAETGDVDARLAALEADNKNLEQRLKEAEFNSSYNARKRQEAEAQLNGNGNGNGKKAAPKVETEDDLIAEIQESLGDPAEWIRPEDGSGSKIVASAVLKAAQKIAKRYQPDVAGEVAKIVNGMVALAGVNETYPELTDQTSEFAKQAGAEIASLQENPAYKSLPPAEITRIAADRVALRLGRTADTGKNGDSDREGRIRRAGGSGGKNKPVSGGKQELDATQRYFARRAGITDEEYIENSTITTYPSL